MADYYGYRVIVGWLYMLGDAAIYSVIAMCVDLALVVAEGFPRFWNAIRPTWWNRSIYCRRGSAAQITEISLSGVAEADTQNAKGKCFVLCGESAGFPALVDLAARLGVQDKRKKVCMASPHFYPEFTVGEQIELDLRLAILEGKQQAETREELMLLLRRFGVKIEAKVATLSREQLKVAHVLEALAGSAEVLVMANLCETGEGEEVDPETLKKLYALIKEKKEDSVILMATKRPEEAELLGDYIAECSAGKRTVNSWTTPGNKYSLVVIPPALPKSRRRIEKSISAVLGVPSAFGAAGTRLKYSVPESKKEQVASLLPELAQWTRKGEVGGYTIGTANCACNGPVHEEVADEIPQRHSLLRTVAAAWVCGVMRSVRSARTVCLEFFLPCCALMILLAAVGYVPSWSYTYSTDGISADVVVPINAFTKYNESTEPLQRMAEGFHTLPVNVSLRKEDLSDVRKIAAAAEERLRTVADQLLGGYYILSCNRTGIQAMIWGNMTSSHSPTLLANLLSNMFLRMMTGNKEAEIKTTVTPVRFYRYAHTYIWDFNMKYLYILVTAAALIIFLSSVAYTVAAERLDHTKSYQLLHGLTALEYWLGRAMCDFSKLILLSGVLIFFHQMFYIEVSNLSHPHDRSAATP